MSINEVSCGPCKAIHYCSIPLERAILWLPGILPLPLVLVFARRSLKGNCPCPALFSRQDKWFMALLCLFGPFTWHKRARVWLKISVLLCRKEPGLGGAFSFSPQCGNPLTRGGGQSFFGWPHQGWSLKCWLVSILVSELLRYVLWGTALGNYLFFLTNVSLQPCCSCGLCDFQAGLEPRSELIGLKEQ